MPLLQGRRAPRASRLSSLSPAPTFARWARLTRSSCLSPSAGLLRLHVAHTSTSSSVVFSRPHLDPSPLGPPFQPSPTLQRRRSTWFPNVRLSQPRPRTSLPRPDLDSQKTGADRLDSAPPSLSSSAPRLSPPSSSFIVHIWRRKTTWPFCDRVRSVQALHSRRPPRASSLFLFLHRLPLSSKLG